ncbi:hypothetical protein L6R52_33120 [Myxococcota bacterium]|nr:hypothetical protein [Myxococcota bacterium]
MPELEPSNTPDLVHRISHLERSARRMRLALGASVTLLGALLLTGQTTAPKARVVEGSAFVLVDDAGRDRAQLSLTKDGATALVLKSADGVSDARLAILGDGGVGLSLRSPRRSANIELAGDGPAAIRLTEKYAKSSVEISLDGAGRPRVLLTDPEGKVTFKAP